LPTLPAIVTGVIAQSLAAGGTPIAIFEGDQEMGKKATKALTVCLDCGAEIRFRRAPHLGQIVTCTQCDTILEVVSRNPLELDWAFADPLEDDLEGEYEYEDIEDEYDYDDEDSYEYEEYEEWDD
jgi:lysine biosynthesis protein LysW